MRSSRVANSRSSLAAVRLVSTLCAGAVSASSAGLAFGDSLGGTVAQALFDAARVLMKERRFAEACPKFAESQRLEPAAGTLLNLALCHELQGKTATAWLEYNDAVGLAAREKNAEREALARQRIAAIEPQLSRLTVVVPQESPRGLWVRLDGVALAVASWGTALPVDPGDHELRYGSPETEERTLRLTVGAGAQQRIELDALRRSMPVLQRQPRPVAHDGAAHAATWSMIGGAGLGIGAAGVVSAAYFGLRASNAWEDRNERCVPRCDDRAADAGERAHDFATVSTLSAIIGVVGIGSGVYALWLRPSIEPTPARPRTARALAASGGVSSGRAEISVRGSF